MKHSNFTNYILRTPFLPIDSVRRLVKDNDISEKALHDICNDMNVMEALYLASPVFYKEVQKWLSGEIHNSKECDKIKQGLLRYFSRMCTRCTPFGMFAGISIGNVDEQTKIYMSGKEENILHVRLDMNYVCALAKDISEIPIVKKHLLFYPNDSIYKVGNKLRYVEYYYKNGKRIHHISSVDATDYLSNVIDTSKGGMNLSGLSNLLVNDDISNEEAYDFIEELVSSQLIISEIEPTVVGVDPLEQMIDTLSKYSNVTEIKNIKDKLTEINELLKFIRKSNLNSIEHLKIFDKIKTILSYFNTEYDDKYLFQADMLCDTQYNTISKSEVENVYNSAKLLNRITPRVENENLKKFREAFYSRYEDEEIPLLQALDTECGIGYIQNAYNGITSMIDDIITPIRFHSYQDMRVFPFQLVLKQKLFNTLHNRERVLKIEETDINGFETVWDDTQNTLSAFVQLTENGQFYVRSIGGSSAANLIGRFCHIDISILKHSLDIIKEDERESDDIYAEIVHLPESRTGNILHRPSIRKYEIPYLASSSRPIDCQITADDLMVSVRNDKIILRSKRLNKNVIPRLSTAHNYSHNALPVYQFLCDMQNYNKRGGFSFSWGFIEKSMPYLPRVEYGNAILSLETWNFFKSDIDRINESKDINKSIDTFIRIIEEKEVPKEVILEDNDNELYLNLNNRFCIKLLINLIKKRTGFTLKEFLFSGLNSPVSSQKGIHANEVLFAYYKNNNHLKS